MNYFKFKVDCIDLHETKIGSSRAAFIRKNSIKLDWRVATFEADPFSFLRFLKQTESNWIPVSLFVKPVICAWTVRTEESMSALMTFLYSPHEILPFEEWTTCQHIPASHLPPGVFLTAKLALASADLCRSARRWR